MIEGAIQVWYTKIVSPLRRAKCQSCGAPFRGKEENKALARRILEDLVVALNLDNLDEYFADDE